MKGNFSRLLAALNELKSLSAGAVCGRGQVKGCLLEGLQEALVQFKRLSQSSKQVSVCGRADKWVPSGGVKMLLQNSANQTMFVIVNFKKNFFLMLMCRVGVAQGISPPRSRSP